MTLFAGYRAALDGERTDIQGHLPLLYQEVADRPGAVVIELGVRTGQSTGAFLAAIEAVGGELWSADITPPAVPAWWHGLEFWHFTSGDDLHPAVTAALPAQCDVLFIDTSHEYDHTLEELRTYVPRIRPGGTGLFHDTQFFPPGHDCGKPQGDVARALGTYCAETGLSWQNRAGWYGMGVLRR